MAGKIIAGSFKEGTPIFDNLQLGNGAMGLAYESLKGNIASVEVVTEANKKKFLGATGWGLVGLATFGVVGAAAGVLAGGNKKEICFACYLKDGRRFMAVTDANLYQKIVADSMSDSSPIGTAEIIERNKEINRQIRAERSAEQARKYQADAARRRAEWESKTPSQQLGIRIGTVIFLTVLAWFTYFLFTGVDPLFGL